MITLDESLKHLIDRVKSRSKIKSGSGKVYTKTPDQNIIKSKSTSVRDFFKDPRNRTNVAAGVVAGGASSHLLSHKPNQTPMNQSLMNQTNKNRSSNLATTIGAALGGYGVYRLLSRKKKSEDDNQIK